MIKVMIRGSIIVLHFDIAMYIGVFFTTLFLINSYHGEKFQAGSYQDVDQFLSYLLRSPSQKNSLGMFREISMVPDWISKVYNLGIDLASTFTQNPYPIKLNEVVKNEYDYIIVGAGGAGSIVASRLSEIPENSVLVLEAGGKESGFTRLGTIGDLWLRSKTYSWPYVTEPEKLSGRGFKGNRVYPFRARMLGGCSSHNGAIWNRGDQDDYNRWAQLGAKGWSWPDVFPYFVKSEKIIPNEIGLNVYDKGYHGTKGPIQVTGNVDPGELNRALLKGCQEVGLKIGDPNGRDHSVTSYSWNNLYNGSRISMASAYLGPASFRPNLDILINAFVHRVDFDENKRAIGVTYERDGKKYQVRARKEVILSGGAYGSPHILLLSGIGPKKELERFKIPLVVDLPGAGKNFQNHPRALVQFTIESNSTLVYIEPEPYIEGAINYVTNRTGAFASIGGRIVGQFPTKYALDSRPDGYIEIITMLDGSFESYILNSYIQQFKNDFVERYLIPNSFEHGFTIGIENQRILSRGEIGLRSPNPYDSPMIKYNFFDVERDLEGMVDVCLLALRIADSKPVQRMFSAKPFPNRIPNCEMFPIGTKEYCRCLILTFTISGSHECGSCKMGSKDDIMAVVDSELRVRGVKGLRVIDASVMPEITTGNTMAPTAVIAERGSDMIKGRVLNPSWPPFKREEDVLRYRPYIPISN